MRSTNPTPLPPRRALGGLSVLGAVSLISVVSVLVLVSLSRLRGFALHENALDARATVRYLADEFALLGEEHRYPQVGRLLENSRELQHALSDTEVLEGGRLLRRHGYLFALVPRRKIERSGDSVSDANSVRILEANAPRPSNAFVVLGWPWRPEPTPLVLCKVAGEIYSLKNAQAEWAGPHLDPQSLPPLELWRVAGGM
ncbi:MAG: hypothetical protein CMJ89_07690 [Planctomycetes bacterium]|nr:hypothetical protein [Planctomycetota bacterium]